LDVRSWRFFFVSSFFITKFETLEVFIVEDIKYEEDPVEATTKVMATMTTPRGDVCSISHH
jgi:hypothetical protein